MTKLRLSGHRLEIETGRYSNTAAETRLCSYCQFTGQETVEDEMHFLLRCPMVSEIREKFLPPQILHDTQISDEEKFSFLMSDNEANDLRQTAKLIYQAFQEREIKLDVLHTLSELVSSTENVLKKPDPGEDVKINHNGNIKKKQRENFQVYGQKL